MSSAVKQEIPVLNDSAVKPIGIPNPSPIDISSDSESSSNSVDSSDVEDLETNSFIDSITSKSKNNRNFGGAEEAPPMKKPKRYGETSSALPLGFLESIPLNLPVTVAVPFAMARVLPDSTCVTKNIGNNNTKNDNQVGSVLCCKQFWKAGDYEGDKENHANSTFSSVGMDHARIHPKFLHSNATSHKWALGAFAELLDNCLDEVVELLFWAMFGRWESTGQHA